jgi:hypothetical protein
MNFSQVKQLKDLKRKLGLYKKIVAELTLKNTVRKDIIRKKALTPDKKQELVEYTRETFLISLG